MAIVHEPKEFDEKVIALDRVARVVKGGRRFRFRATVVVGDGKGRVGVGVGKGGEVMTSIAKAVSIAKKHLVVVPLREGTIPHEVEMRYSGAHVLLKPASAGTGVIAGGAVRNVVEAAGIRDLLAKSMGSSSKVNNAYATLIALSQLRPGRPKPRGHHAPSVKHEAAQPAKDVTEKKPAAKTAEKPKAAAAKTTTKKAAK
jgi:small subunit ribosomal protein S5